MRSSLCSLAALAALALSETPPAAARPTRPDAASAPAARGIEDLPPLAQAAISATLGRERAAYRAEAAGAGFRLRNPAHALDTEVTASRLEIRSGSASWGLALAAWGHGDRLEPVATAVPLAKDNRVVLERGDLSEWYVNGPLGLQQGFTLKQPPSGGPSDGPLTLALAQTGKLAATLDPDRRGLSLSGADGANALRYRGLTAYDATGRELPAWLELRGTEPHRAELLVRVDSTAAVYPVVVDPFLEQAKLTASDSVGTAYFGWSLSLSGDTVLVGAFADTSSRGAAYVFVKPASGWATTSAFDAKLTASDAANSDSFGFSVSLDGDTALIGASGDDSKGSAYVFVKPMTGWATTSAFDAKLTASDGAASDQFGTWLTLEGDTALIGASGDDSKGSAYVFVKPMAGWATTSAFDAKLTASDGAASDQFGAVVSLSQDTALIGAYGDDGSKGAAYVFVKPPTGWATTSAFDARLTASDGAADDSFGRGASISNDVALLGAYRHNGDRGAAYVFVKPLTGWATTSAFDAKLTASDAAAGDRLGLRAFLQNDTALLGAHGDESQTGAAYVFVKPPTGWATTAAFDAKLTASDGVPVDQLGVSLAISGDTVMVGSHAHGANKGIAYVFQPPPTPTPSVTPTATSTETATPTSTPTVTATGTSTPSATDTATATPTSTSTATATGTSTPTVTGTATPTSTSTATATGTSTPTVTDTALPTPSPTATPVSIDVHFADENGLSGAPVSVAGQLPDGDYCLCVAPNGRYSAGSPYSDPCVSSVSVVVDSGTLDPTVVWAAASPGSYDLLVLAGACSASQLIAGGDDLDTPPGLLVSVALQGPNRLWLLGLLALSLGLLGRKARTVKSA